MSGEAAATCSGADVHLRGTPDRTALLLRQELVGLLRAGVRHVRVHADDQPDVDLEVLRSLDAARRVLCARGGSLVLLGAGQRARARLRVHGLDAVLPPPAQVYPAGDVVAPAAVSRTSSR